MVQLVKNLPAMWETWVRSLGWEGPLEKGKAIHSNILAWRIPWTVYPWGREDKTEQLSLSSPSEWGFPGGSDGKEAEYNAGDMGSIPGSRDPMEKGMDTYSSILAWRIPWTEEPGKLQSMGLQIVRHG